MPRDISEIPDLLDRIDTEVASLTTDDAYDGEAIYDAVAERHPSATGLVVTSVPKVPF